MSLLLTRCKLVAALTASSSRQVNIRNIELVNNPAKFDDGYHFRIKFEAIAPLAEGQCRQSAPQ